MKKLLMLLTAITLSCYTTDAQIICTDVDPDVFSVVDPGAGAADNIAAIDFDGDGTKEYDFRWDHYGGDIAWFVHIKQSGSNEINLQGTSTNPYGARYVQAMHEGEAIGESCNWGLSYPEPLIADGYDNNFMDTSDKFIGVRFTLDENVHYGWIRVSFNEEKVLTIKAYAYDATPGKAINAGDTASESTTIGKHKHPLINTRIFPNPVSYSFSFDKAIAKNISGLQIVDITGKTVLTTNNSCDTGSVDVTALESGTYFVRFYSKGQLMGFSRFVKQ